MLSKSNPLRIHTHQRNTDAIKHNKHITAALRG
jgi:hypothetical protein